MNMNITSLAFQNGATMPRQYTADGANISPPLAWSALPTNTRSLALILDDPDAPMGTWIHWVVYNISPQTSQLEADVPAQRILASGVKQGINSFHRIGYGGPAPPPGKPHRYFFRLYALDMVPKAEPGLSAQQIVEIMTGHILAEAQYVGIYGR